MNRNRKPLFKTALGKTETGIRFIENALVVVCGAIFLLLMLLGTADVIGRTVFSKPIIGTYEMSEMMMGAIVLLGWAYTQKNGGHITVDLVYERFPAGMKKVTDTIVTFITLGLFVIIMIQSWGIAIKYMAQGRQFIILDMASWPFYFLVPVGAFFLCLELIIQLSRHFHALGEKL